MLPTEEHSEQSSRPHKSRDTVHPSIRMDPETTMLAIAANGGHAEYPVVTAID